MNVKKALADSLYDIMNEVPVSRITVQMILNRSGISRSAFYHHFRDKFDVMNWYYAFHVGKILEKRDGNNYRALILEILEFIENNSTYSTAIMKMDGPDQFIPFLRKYTVNIYSETYTGALGLNNLGVYDKLMIEYTAIGQIGLIQQWVLNGFIDPADTVAAVCYNLMPETLRRYF